MLALVVRNQTVGHKFQIWDPYYLNVFNPFMLSSLWAEQVYFCHAYHMDLRHFKYVWQMTGGKIIHDLECFNDHLLTIIKWAVMKLWYIALRLGKSNILVNRWSALTWHAAIAHTLSTWSLKFNLSSIHIPKALILETKETSLSFTCNCIDDTLWPQLKSIPWNVFGFAPLHCR